MRRLTWAQRAIATAVPIVRYGQKGAGAAWRGPVCPGAFGGADLLTDRNKYNER